MGSVSVRLQSIWHKHEQEHKNRPSETREALGRAIEDELLEDPQVDRKDILASQMAAALRKEMAMDAKGRRYSSKSRCTNHPRRCAIYILGEYGFAPHDATAVIAD